MNFNEKYEILKPLGKGGTASVFLARDRKLRKYWAVKIVEKKENCSERMLERIRREISILRQLDGTGMLRIADMDEDSHRICMVTDFVRGRTLKDYIYHQGCIDEKEAAMWLYEICSIFQQLHNMNDPVIYCDLKPENIMLRDDGQLILIDFGSAWQLCGRVLAEERTGTYGYAAPELFSDKRLPEPATDIYGVGALAVFLITGVHPAQICRITDGEPPRCSVRMKKIIRRCMMENPAFRYQDCGQLKKDLQKFYKK